MGQGCDNVIKNTKSDSIKKAIIPLPLSEILKEEVTGHELKIN